MINDISSTTSAFRDRSLEAALDALGTAGFPQAEITGAEPHVGSTGEKEQARIRGVFEAHSVRARTMHAPAGRYILAALDEDWRRESAAVLSRYVRLAGGLGLTEMVIHPIPNPDLAPVDDPELPGRMREAVQRSLDDLMPTIEESEIRVTLENLPYPGMPLNNMRELRAVVEPYPSSAVGLVIDTGHVGVLELDPVDELHAAGERLCGTHVHDVDLREGRVDHHSPTLGNLDWAAMRQAFTDIGYAGPWTSEATKPSHGESAEELAREVSGWLTAWVG